MTSPVWTARKCRRRLTALALAVVGFLTGSLAPLPANAGCSSTPIVGGLLVDCAATIAPDPTAAVVAIPSGNNVLQIFSGTYNGGFTIAGGNNLIAVTGAQVNAGVTSGAGNDQFGMSAGAITGNVNQGDGADTFTMSGGQVGSLQQGGGLDTFLMSSGTIANAFTEGDFITITGGTIGSVDMTIGNNIFAMSGGVIVGNVVAGFQNDTFTLSGGQIGGGVNLGNGTNTLTISGGGIGTGITTGIGTDTLTWSGGVVAGAIDLGSGNDTGTLANLTAANLTSTTAINGGLGTDQLTLSNTVASAAGLFQNWEAIGLTNNSQLTLTGNLALGDAGTATGAVSIDGSSALLVRGAVAIAPFTGGQLVSVTNAGSVDLSGGSAGVTDALTIVGNYAGNNGALYLDTQLGGDASPTDQLIIDSGAATGSTGVHVANAGGVGALTSGNGIPIIVVQNGGTTAGAAFALAAPVAAGPFQYLLFRGPPGVGTPEEQNSWFLRSQLDPDGLGGSPPIPLYRPETSMYAALPGLARTLGLTTLGTFHERNGDQGLARGEGGSERAWGRIFGGHIEQAYEGTLGANFSGYAGGIQFGVDALHYRSISGEEDVAGLFFAVPQARGDVNGFAIGVIDAYAGNTQLTGPSMGAYWTHLGPGNWYLDAVTMVSFYEAIGTSTNNASIDVEATGVIASLEGGWPLALGGGVTLEPQAQLVYQNLDFEGARDIFSTVDIEAPDVLTGRLGLRLAGVFGAGPNAWRPYLKVNLWHDWAGTDRTIYAGVHELDSKYEVTALEAGGGLVAQLTDGVGLWGDAGYTTDVDGSDLEVVRGSAGVKVNW